MTFENANTIRRLVACAGGIALSVLEVPMDDYDGLRVPIDDLQPAEDTPFHFPYGGGPFSDFFKIKYEGKRKDIPALTSMKVWRGQSYDADAFIIELVKGVKKWSTLNHDNIVPLFGICAPSLRAFPGILVPYYANGNVVKYLNENPAVPVTSLLVDILRGLSYVHSRGAVHGELKGSNVLIDDSGHARLTDFGFSNQMCDQVLTAPNTAAIFRWFAPELLDSSGDIGGRSGIGSNVTPASDVYSFAMTALEMYTLKQPFANIRNHAAVIINVMSMDQRPQRPSAEEAPQLTDDMWEVITDCWVREPRCRPRTELVGQRVFGLHLMRDLDV